MASGSLKKWLAQPAHSTVLQMPRALLASVCAAILDCGILVMLVERGGWQPLTAAIASYFLAGILQYILCVCWVFPHAPSSHASGFTTFTFLSLVGLAITGVVMASLHDWAHLPYTLAKGVALGLAFSWNFTSRKLVVFRPQAHEQW